MRGRAWALFGVGVSFGLAACFSFGDLSGGSDSSDAGSDVTADSATDGSAGDSSNNADTGSEAGTNGPCNLAAPFQAPVLVPEDWDAAAGEGNATLTVDGLTMFFASPVQLLGNPHTLLYEATRTDAAAPFENPVELGAIDSADAGTFQPSLRGDQRVLAFTSGRTGSQGLDIYLSSRVSASDSFVSVSLVPGSDGPVNDFNPYLRFDGQVLYFGSDRDDAGTGQLSFGRIYRSTYSIPNNFVNPVLLTELTSGKGETSPVVTPDDLTIFFESQRGIDGGPGLPALVFEAQRASANDPFGAVRHLDELDMTNGSIAVAPTYVTSDGCTLYLNVLTPNGFRIEYAQRPK